MEDPKQSMRRAFRTRMAPPMFYLSLVFLALFAALLVLWIDVPRVLEPLEEADFDGSLQALPAAAAPAEDWFETTAVRWGNVVGRLLMLLWPVFILEQIIFGMLSSSWRQFRQHHPFAWLICLVPPLRLGARNREAAGEIWFPLLGWQQPCLAFQRQLERKTSIPMIGIALLILPVLGLQQKFGEDIVNYPALRMALHVGTGIIWFAFATEFLVVVSVTDQKLNYCKKHWLDLVIIVLPLISFLRSLRLLRAAKLLKLQQLSRLVRVYRLRGVTMRALRALMLLDVLQRILRVQPEKRLAKLELAYQEKEHELELLRQEIESLRERHELPAAAPATAPGDEIAGSKMKTGLQR